MSQCNTAMCHRHCCAAKREGGMAEGLSAVQILPIFEMTRQRPNAHFGAFGDNAEKGNADCKHYCLHMSDWWNTVLYNMIF